MKNVLTVKLVQSTLTELMGNKAAVARKLGVTRQAVHEYVKKRPELEAVELSVRESMIDNTESVLYREAMKGEAWAVCFFLKTQARHRGYTERQEVNISGKDGGPLVIAFARDWRNDEGETIEGEIIQAADHPALPAPGSANSDAFNGKVQVLSGGPALAQVDDGNGHRG